MSAKLIDGNALAARVKENVQQHVAALARQGKRVHLTAILVGSPAGGELYAKRQAEACRAVGIEYELKNLPETCTAQQLTDVIHQLNEDQNVTGIMLHLPLPRHLDETEMQYEINPRKDVEGINPANIGHVVYRHTLIAPCTALAAIECIKSTGIAMRGADAVVVGASAIAGKPISLLLTEELATVTLCHIATKDLREHTRRADIVVVAVGKPNLITAEHIREGAVVIDVGINRITLPDGTKKTVGDVDFEGVRQKASYITPVPGGVGPMTVAMLLENSRRCAGLVWGIDFQDDTVPPTTQACPVLPITYLRRTELRDFLREILRGDKPKTIAEIYQQVLGKFGADQCRPEEQCPYYSSAHPEFQHVVRLALWDGQRAGEFSRVASGVWKKI